MHIDRNEKETIRRLLEFKKKKKQSYAHDIVKKQNIRETKQRRTTIPLIEAFYPKTKA